MLRLLPLLLGAALSLDHPVVVSASALWSHTLGLAPRYLGALGSRMSRRVGHTIGSKVSILTRFLRKCLLFFATRTRSSSTQTASPQHGTISARHQCLTQTTLVSGTSLTGLISTQGCSTTTSSTRRSSLCAMVLKVLIALWASVNFPRHLLNSTTTPVANAKERPS